MKVTSIVRTMLPGFPSSTSTIAKQLGVSVADVRAAPDKFGIEHPATHRG